MPTDFNTIDPAWAWSAYEPTGTNPWDRKAAAHLYRRAAFGATGAELDAAVRAGPTRTIDTLCIAATSADFETSSALLADAAVAAGEINQLAGWWIYRMLNTPDPLLEKLTLFWHGHFATSDAKVAKPRLMYGQNQLLREHARGNFRDMVLAISRDPAMLVYLDSTTNRRIHPNENYARELMELFTLGVGNYTEQDIKEVARAFTGWEILGDHFHFDTGQHDTHAKTFLGQTGDCDGAAAVDIILRQPAAPRFIARKLARFFVLDEPALPQALIEPLAIDLREHDFAIGPVVRRILSSNLFFSPMVRARKVRSPVEWVVGLPRALGASTSLLMLAQCAADLGQALFQPPNVKGWDGGRMWINSSTLLARANAVRDIVQSGETRFGKGASLAEVARQAGATSPDKVIQWLDDLFLAAPLPGQTRKDLVDLQQAGGDPDWSAARVICALGALPEFQLA